MCLGVVRSLHAMGRLEKVYACETRPYNQGARLTAFEIITDELPGTLICDSMAAALMAVKGVDAVVVGADRVAANGDTANKIGTYQLAISAHYHGIPFYVAAPTTSLDTSIPNGSKIQVEQRPADELTCIFGQRIAPVGIEVWNPGFDVTPCKLITGIITEIGIADGSSATGSDGPKADGVLDKRIIDIAAFLRSMQRKDLCIKAVPPTLVPVVYKYMNVEEITKLCQSSACLGSRLGYGDLLVNEVGDGNLNFVYIVTNVSNAKSIVIKQALPYVRCVGDSWPLSLERAEFEHRALILQRSYCVEHVPEVFLFEPRLALTAMQYIPEPHLILRKVLMKRSRVSTFASHLGDYMAKSLFKSSVLALSGPVLREEIAYWSKNIHMCALTEQVIFTDPFVLAKYNSHTSPQLDQFVARMREDELLKLRAVELKIKFMGCAQALVHGDLHTGSVMAHEGSTFVIDPEFAFYG